MALPLPPRTASNGQASSGAPEDVVPVPGDAVQFSPLVPGAAILEDVPEGSLAGLVMLAPPGTIERRYGLALALRALAPGAPFTILAPKDRGGARLGAELADFGCAVDETAKRHHRICAGSRPPLLAGIEAAVAAGAPRLLADLGVWSQPGIFSWDRIDPGSDLLMRTLPALRGRGADLGCGLGSLARTVLASPKVEHLTLIDIDRRAVTLARRNIPDPRVETRWSDLRHAGTGLKDLDFVVMNPPFHEAGSEDRAWARCSSAAPRNPCAPAERAGSPPTATSPTRACSVAVPCRDAQGRGRRLQDLRGPAMSETVQTRDTGRWSLACRTREGRR